MRRPPALVRGVLVALMSLTIGALPLAVPTSAEAATRTLKVLVVPVHFGTKLDTVASAKKLVQTQTGGWLRTVSRQRLALTTTVVPVTKVASGCSSVAKRAQAAAAAKGYRLSRYDVVIVLAPTCADRAPSDHATTSTGDPDVVTAYGRAGRSVSVLAHQFGYVFGFENAKRYDCYRNGRSVTIDAPKNCFHWVATEDVDVMGGGPSEGSFAAPELAQLGWFAKSEIVTRTMGTSTTSLVPLLGRGVRTVKVVHKQAVYWIEFRQPTGVDRAQPGPHLKV